MQNHILIQQSIFTKRMTQQIQRIFICLFVCMLTIPAFAQVRISTGKAAVTAQKIGAVNYAARKNFTDKADLPPNFIASMAKNIPNGNGGMNTQAMWDIQFQYDITTTSGYPSQAGVVWTGSEFWVSKWNGADTLLVYDASGAFQGILSIAGIGNVRGMTTDGTTVYAANNTTSIVKISLLSSSVTGTMTVPTLTGGVGTRFVTYDNSTTPGLWIGNFNTEIVKVNIPASGAATVITTIPAATHGITGMYGGAYDGASPGGPYLWIFTQTDPLGGLSRATIAQVQLPGGTFTGITRNVNADLLVNDTTGLAGGLTIAQLPGYTYRSLIGVDQGIKMIGYELNFVSVNVTDVRADSLDPVNGLTLWPWVQNGPVNLAGKVKNVGNVTVNGISKVIRMYDGTGAITNTYTTPSTNLVAGASQVYNVGPWTAAAPDFYTAINRVSATGDVNGANDSTAAYILVNDSVFARDYASYGQNVGGLGVGQGTVTQSAFGQIYPLNYMGKLTSITAYFSGPRTAGDQVSLSVYNATATAPGTSLLASTGSYTFTQTDVDSGVVITLPLLSGPLSLMPGNFFVCVNEGDSLCGIATTTDIYAPNRIFAKSSLFNSGAWTDVGLLVAGGVPVKRAFVIRPNFACRSANFVGNVTTTSTGCGQALGTATASATGGTSPYSYTWGPNQTSATLSNLAAGIYTVTIRDAANCITTTTGTVTNPNAPSATASAQNPACAGNAATLTAQATGGQAPYTYTWNTVPVQYSQTALVSVSGTYIVNITDALGCTSAATATVTMPSVLNAAATSTNVTCNGGNDGSATAVATGGTGSLTYSWSNGLTGQTITGLASGNYTVTVTDANGCQRTAVVIITQPTAINVATSSVGSTGTNGSATATPSGGTSPYSYSWNTGQTTGTISNLAPGTYTVVVTDASGCTKTMDVVVPNLVAIDFAQAGINVFEAFPNPNKGEFSVKLELQNADNVKVYITDLSGKKVYSSEQKKVSLWNENISLKNLSSGVYMLSVETTKGKAFVKLMIE